MFLGHESQGLARDILDREHALDVVQHGIRLTLFVELGVAPVLGNIVGLSFGGEVFVGDHFLGQRHQPQGLREGLDRVHVERAGLEIALHFEVAALGVIADVGQVALRHRHLRQTTCIARLVDLGGNFLDRIQGDLA